jgi:hypothetical protein
VKDSWKMENGKMAVLCPTKLNDKRINLTKEALLQHNE